MSTERKKGNGNGGDLGKPREIIQQTPVEVRFADLESDRDIEAVTDLFGQSSVIEHLAGIAPTVTSRNIKKFRERLPELMPDLNIDPNEIIIATKTEIGAYFRSKDKSKARLLIAQSVGPNPEILGAVMAEKPGGGITYVSVAKLAVSEKARKRGVGSVLVKAASALALCRVEDGGWGYSGASGGIIQVSGSEKPQSLFQRNKYIVQATRPNGCIGWDNKTGQFVPRDVILVILDGANYKPDPSCLPKKAA